MSISKGLLWSLAVALLAAQSSAVSEPVDNLVVSVRVRDKGEKERLRVDQTVQVSNDGQLNFFSGGELAGTGDAPALEFGTRITGKLGDFEGETRTLTLRVELSRRFVSGDSEVPVVSGEVIAFRVAIKPEETTRVTLGENRVCELRLDRQTK